MVLHYDRHIFGSKGEGDALHDLPYSLFTRRYRKHGFPRKRVPVGRPNRRK